MRRRRLAQGWQDASLHPQSGASRETARRMACPLRRHAARQPQGPAPKSGAWLARLAKFGDFGGELAVAIDGELFQHAHAVGEFGHLRLHRFHLAVLVGIAARGAFQLHPVVDHAGADAERHDGDDHGKGIEVHDAFSRTDLARIIGPPRPGSKRAIYRPVEPNPPPPRLVSSSTATWSSLARVTGATIICAMRSPRLMMNGSCPRLIRITFTSPR